MTIISGVVSDSAGALESGRVEFAQAQRFDDGSMLITQSVASAQVVGGRLRALDGSEFSLPANPSGTAVRVREMFGGKTFEWWTAVPDSESVEYRELPIVETSSVPESVWGPPPWVAEVGVMRDQAVAAVASGIEVAEALGGLAGIQALNADAHAAANRSAVSAAEAAASAVAAESAASTAAAGVLAATAAQADRAKSEADRAEDAASSIDMGAINTRLDGVDNRLGGLDALVASKASIQYVDDAVANAVSSTADLVAAIRYPVYIAHRGALRVFPEHSMEAYDACFTAGFTPEADVKAIASGKLVCIHDTTTNRTMSISKSVALVTDDEWRKATINPPRVAEGARGIEGSGRGTPVFFEDYLDRFGGRVVLWPELKDNGAAATAAIKAITDRGLQKSVVIQNNTLATCQEIVAAGCHALILTNSLAPATIAAAGIEFVGVSLTATLAYVQSLVAAGLKVISYTANSKADADAQLAKGAVGIFSDDPWEVSRDMTPLTSLDLTSGFLPFATGHGIENSGAAAPGTGNQLIEVSNGTLLFTGGTGAAFSYANSIKLGQFGYGLPGTVRVRLWAQAISPWAGLAAPEGGWLFGVYLGAQSGDVPVNEEALESSFRLAMVRRDGRKHGYEKRTKTGSVSAIGNTAATTPPYAKPGGRSAPMQFEILFTPTSLTISNLTLNDVDLDVAASSLTIPGAYLTLSLNGANGRVWGVEVSK